jgi:hypothetical protein
MDRSLTLKGRNTVVEEIVQGREGFTVEDGTIAIEIFLRALTFRPLIQQKSFGEDFAGLSIQQIIPETLEPRVMVLHMGPSGKFPCLFFRFVGTESPVVEAIFYPYEPILFFLSQARSYVQWATPTTLTDEEKESLARDEALQMTLIMLDSFYRRSELTMDSFTSEVFAHWRLQQTEKIAHYKAERGEKIPPGKNPVLGIAVNNYTRELTQFWKYLDRAYGGGQKVRFVAEYDEVYPHWKRLHRMSSEDDWREYAKAGRFADTPDDLIDKLEDVDRSDQRAVSVKVSDLALEHAGRRARLINKQGVSQSVMRQRKAGIRVTGYTNTQLFNILKEGRQIAERLKEVEAAGELNESPANFTHDETQQLLDQNGNSTQIDSAK